MKCYFIGLLNLIITSSCYSYVGAFTLFILVTLTMVTVFLTLPNHSTTLWSSKSY